MQNSEPSVGHLQNNLSKDHSVANVHLKNNYWAAASGQPRSALRCMAFYFQSSTRFKSQSRKQSPSIDAGVLVQFIQSVCEKDNRNNKPTDKSKKDKRQFVPHGKNIPNSNEIEIDILGTEKGPGRETETPGRHWLDLSSPLNLERHSDSSTIQNEEKRCMTRKDSCLTSLIRANEKNEWI